MAKYVLNEKLNGIEITFESVPTVETRNQLKENGFRWSSNKGIWYAKQTPERIDFAWKLEAVPETGDKPKRNNSAKAKAKTTDKTTPAKVAPVKEEPVNEYGVKVGDLFYDVWGYDATIYDFYQVVALRGTKQIVLRPIGEEKRQINFCEWESKPQRNAFLTGAGYITRLCSGNKIEIVKTVKANGNQISAGGLFPGSWDRVYHCDNYH